MVKTKCIKDPVENADGERILVTRYWPRWIKKEDLALAAWEKTVPVSGLLTR